MTYIDVVLYAVPNANKDAFQTMCTHMAPFYKKYGAVFATNLWGDEILDGKRTSFPLAVKCEADETVAMSLVAWQSKAARKEGRPKAISDMMAVPEIMAMPFDGARMIFGSFDALTEN